MFEDEVPMECSVIPMDNALIYLTKGQQNKLESMFGCHEFPCYMGKFLSMEDAYFLAVPERKEIFENYMKTVYSTPIDFKVLQVIDLEKSPDVPPITVYSVSGMSKENSIH